MKTRHTGFGIVKLLIVIVVVGVLGAAGWFVYDRQNNSNSSTANQQSENKTKVSIAGPKQPTVPTDKVINARFSVELPSDWSRRICMDHEGLGAIVAGGDGDMKCIWDDATWLGVDMAARGRVAIGYGVSPYPRQDYSSGQQRDVYESDAQEMTLSNEKVVLKYNYTAQDPDNKEAFFDVVEYTVDGKVGVFIFDGHSAEGDYGDQPTSAEVIRIMQDIILPSITLL